MIPAPTPLPRCLCLHLLGGFRAVIGGQTVAASRWRLRKAQHLVALLALAPGHRLHRDPILEHLWPNHDPVAADNNLDRTLYAARQALAAADESPARCLPRHSELVLLLPPAGLWIDVEAFTAAAATARRTRDIAAYQAALTLYPGDLLPEASCEDWAAPRREGLRQEYLALRLALAALHEEQGDAAASIALLQDVIASEPAHEAAHRALMRLYAATGRRHAALRQYEQLVAVLERDLAVSPEVASQQLYQTLLAGQATASIPPLQRDPMPARTLPVPVTSFIGREQELAEVRRQLSATRLLTLTGAGGVGKTRLALAVAQAVQPDYPDGVWLVDLASLADAALVPPTVARVLGVQEQPDQALLETLTNWLAPKHLLLVLDNCEHVLDTCAVLVDRVLRAAPHVRILATSREALSIGGEARWRVPSLAVPTLASAVCFELVAPIAAVRLFNERAKAVQPAFALTQQNAAAVAEICRRLDGIPLALELAAARVLTLTPAQILARLDDRFRLLTGGSRTALPRQQTLRATIDWSYDLLSEPERVLLRRLAVFASGWTLEAAEAVAAGDGLAPEDILDLLTRLVAKSLVVGEEPAHPRLASAVRYRLLETVRQYALDRLIETGEVLHVRRRHRDWCLALAAQAAPALYRHDQLIWLARLEVEYDNLRAALAWCLDDEPATGLRLASYLLLFWQVQQSYAEGQRWLEACLIRAPERTVVRVAALVEGARLVRAQGDLHTARVWLEQGLALSRELADPWHRAWALRELAHQCLFESEPELARRLAEEGLALTRTAGDQFGLGRCLFTLAWLAVLDGDYRQARGLAEEGLAAMRALGDRLMSATLLWLVGSLAMTAGDLDQAAALLGDGLALAEEVGSSTTLLRWQLGELARWRGDLGRAAAEYEAGLTVARAAEARAFIGRHLGGLGRVAHERGETAAAAARLQESLALMQAVDYKPGIAYALQGLGLLALSQGDHDKATALLREALVMRRAVGERVEIVESLETLATMAVAQGEPAQAMRLLGATAALRAAMGTPLPPAARPGIEAVRRSAMAVLADEEMAVVWAEGLAMTLEQAVGMTLAEERAG